MKGVKKGETTLDFADYFINSMTKSAMTFTIRLKSVIFSTELSQAKRL